MSTRGGVALALIAQALGSVTDARAGLSSAGCRHVATSGMAAATVRAINRVRARHGLHEVTADRLLTCAARRHVRRMARLGFFGHVWPDATTLVDRLATAGYLRGGGPWQVGEVLARMPRGTTGRAVVRAWMNSPGHRSEVLGPYPAAGAAVTRDGSSVLVTVDFGRRD